MKDLNRRKFLKTSALALGAGLISRSAFSANAQPIGSNGDIRLGIIGLGRKGGRWHSYVIKLVLDRAHTR
jgi:hypothetical protein